VSDSFSWISSHLPPRAARLTDSDESAATHPSDPRSPCDPWLFLSVLCSSASSA